MAYSLNLLDSVEPYPLANETAAFRPVFKQNDTCSWCGRYEKNFPIFSHITMRLVPTCRKCSLRILAGTPERRVEQDGQARIQAGRALEDESRGSAGDRTVRSQGPLSDSDEV